MYLNGIRTGVLTWFLLGEVLRLVLTAMVIHRCSPYRYPLVRVGVDLVWSLTLRDTVRCNLAPMVCQVLSPGICPSVI